MQKERSLCTVITQWSPVKRLFFFSLKQEWNNNGESSLRGDASFPLVYFSYFILGLRYAGMTPVSCTVIIDMTSVLPSSYLDEKRISF